MNLKYIFFFFITLLNVQISFAQFENHDPAKLTADEHLRLADRYFAESIFYSAAQNYQAFLEKKPADRYATYWLAMALYEARDYEAAAATFKDFYAISPKKENQQKQFENENASAFKLGNLYYGMALHRIGDYEKAKNVLGKFRSGFQTNDDKEFTTLTTLAKRIMQACDSVAALPKAKVKTKQLTQLSSAYNEGAPFALNEDILYYHSLNQNSLQQYKYYKNDFHTTIFQASKNENGEWDKNGKIVSVGVNDPKYWVGNGAFNANRDRFYFTKCLEMDDDRALCNIFVADVKNGKMAEPTRLPEGINFEYKYTTTQPTVRTINSQSETIYFASDRDGGEGGLDIWSTTRDKDGKFSAPRLVGGGVNTVGDEVTPFFNDSTKTLYFSSDGHIGFGGFDVFSLAMNSEEREENKVVKNMGKPINSGADDLYFSKSSDQTHGFMTTNRKGSKPLNDIATASDDIFEWENLKFAVEGNVKVTGNDTNPVDNARFTLFKKNPDGTKELIAVDSTAKNGNYFFKLNPDEDYVVEVANPGFINTYEELTTRGLDNEDTLEQNFKVNKDAYVVFGKVVEDGKPDNVLEEATIIVYEVTPEGKEILIAEEQMQKGEKQFGMRLPTGKDYKLMSRKDGYFAGTTLTSTKNIGNSQDSIRADISMKKMQLNVEYRLNNILYDFAKATLRPQSMLVLDTLYGIMVDNPGMVIELSSHTDSVGSDAANFKLSKARAKSCVDYLISKGIATTRMYPMGYGESRPIAPNSLPDGKDNPEGRAMNRRTEFKILKM